MNRRLSLLSAKSDSSPAVLGRVATSRRDSDEPTKRFGRGLRPSNRLVRSSKSESLLFVPKDDGVKEVSFGSIEIREHERQLVSHPSCPDAFSLGLGWGHSDKSKSIPVEKYEKLRSKKKKKGRGADGMLAEPLDTYKRAMLLKKACGYKQSDLVQICKSYDVMAKVEEERLAVDAWMSINI